MPRIKQNYELYARKDFMEEIAVCKVRNGISKDSEIATKIGMTAATYSKKKRNPDCMTVKELRGLIRIMNPDKETTLKFIGY